MEGKDGRRHRYLQALIKRIGEENGFRAIIEKPILEGQGQVDVGPGWDDMTVPCEISVTRSGQQQLGNIQK